MNDAKRFRVDDMETRLESSFGRESANAYECRRQRSLELRGILGVFRKHDAEMAIGRECTGDCIVGGRGDRSDRDAGRC